MLTVATANVNGIRAALRRGMGPWLEGRAPDVLCLQEVRAPDEVMRDLLGPGWHGVHEEAAAKGRAGVAVVARTPPVDVRTGLTGSGGASDGASDGTSDGTSDGGDPNASGRWVEADLRLPDGALLTVVSVYVHTGEAGTPRQDEKYRFLDAMRARMDDLAADGRHVLVCGDLNIAHREEDLKNWRGNRDKAGFLPGERAWMDRLFEAGWVDVHRTLAGDGPGPYSWWSWRGKAFDNDAGWRIDYQIASASLAPHAVKAEVDRAPTYAERWSDHAPVVVTYDV